MSAVPAGNQFGMTDALIEFQAAGQGLRRSPKGASPGRVHSSEPALFASLAGVQT